MIKEVIEGDWLKGYENGKCIWMKLIRYPKLDMEKHKKYLEDTEKLALEKAIKLRKQK